MKIITKVLQSEKYNNTYFPRCPVLIFIERSHRLFCYFKPKKSAASLPFYTGKHDPTATPVAPPGFDSPPVPFC